MNKIKLSIITTTLNSSATLRYCFESLAQQSIPFEHVIIDGGSVDGTCNIINENITERSQVVSEPDNGLYDALNKGIRASTGEVVGILHADDFYASDDVLEKVAKVFEDESVDSCYGDLIYVKDQPVSCKTEAVSEGQNKKFKLHRYWKAGAFDPNKFYWGWMPPHPTFFVRRSVYEKYGLFNLEMGTAADYELMLRFLLKNRINVAYIPEVLVCMRTGGMSNASLGNRLRANRNDRKAWDINGLKPYLWTIPLKPLRKIPQWFEKSDYRTPIS